MTTIRCPQCDNPFDTTTTEAMPFCSKRCKLIDLGRWFNEENSVPHEPDPDEYVEEPPDSAWN